MIIEAHYNNHGTEDKPVRGDLLVTFSFPGEEGEDLCVGIDKRWMDAKDKDNYMPGWRDRITAVFSNDTGRTLSEDDQAAIDAAIKDAVVQ